MPRPTVRVHGRPLLRMWTRPRETIRGIVDRDASYGVIPLAWLAGTAEMLAGSMVKLDRPGYWPLLVFMAVVLAPLFGMAGVYLRGAVMSWVGRLLGGRATAEESRAAVAWSHVPEVALLPLWIPVLLFVGPELFAQKTPGIDADVARSATLHAFGLLQGAAMLWGGVLAVKCLAEVHQFSAWRALGAIALALAVVVVLVVGGVLLLLDDPEVTPAGPNARGGTTMAAAPWPS